MLSAIELRLLLLFIGFASGHNAILQYSRFASDFAKRQASPRAVIENLCWNKKDKMRLEKLLEPNAISFGSYSRNSSIFDTIYHPHTFIVLANVDCEFHPVWKKALESDIAVYPNVWLVYGDTGVLKEHNYFVPINSLLLSLEGDRIKSIYKVHRNDYRYIEHYIANYPVDNRSFSTTDLNQLRKRNDFMGMPLRVSYIVTHNDTLNHLTDYRDKHLDSVTKINYILYNFLCDLFNATHIMVLTHDWGFESGNNGTFTKGLFVDLIEGRADIGGTVVFTPASRVKYFKYLFVPNKDFAVRFVFRAPSLAYYTNLFVLPFDLKVWLVIGGLMVTATLLIQMIFAWEVKPEAFYRYYHENEENSPTVLDSVIIQMAILCQADFWPPPKSISGMIALFTILMTFTFIYTAFSARIVLLLQTTTDQINDYRQLYAANMEFGVDNQIYNVHYFKTPTPRANEHWRRLIYETRIRKSIGDQFFDPDKGMELVRNTYFAFNTEVTIANYFIDKTFNNEQRCSVRMVDSIYKPDLPHLPIPRNSSYLEFFKVGFHWLAETGVHNRESRRSYSKRPICEGQGNFFVSVGLIEVYFALMVYVYGVSISLILLTVEIFAHRYLKRNCAF